MIYRMLRYPVFELTSRTMAWSTLLRQVMMMLCEFHWFYFNIQGLLRKLQQLFFAKNLAVLELEHACSKARSIYLCTRVLIIPQPNLLLNVFFLMVRIFHLMLVFFYYYYYWYSAVGPVWAETRVQSGDWYGSGTLHPGQVLRGSLPLLSPTFYIYIYKQQ